MSVLGGTAVAPGDVEEIKDLFKDAKTSAKTLMEHDAKYLH